MFRTLLSSPVKPCTNSICLSQEILWLGCVHECAHTDQASETRSRERAKVPLHFLYFRSIAAGRNSSWIRHLAENARAFSHSRTSGMLSERTAELRAPARETRLLHWHRCCRLASKCTASTSPQKKPSAANTCMLLTGTNITMQQLLSVLLQLTGFRMPDAFSLRGFGFSWLLSLLRPITPCKWQDVAATTQSKLRHLEQGFRMTND